MKTFQALWIPLLSGLLLGLSFYHYSLAFIPWLVLAPFFYTLFQCRTLPRALGISFLFGLVFYLTVFFWITIVTTWVGVLGYLAWLGVALYLALIFAGVGAFFFFIGHHLWSRLLALPFGWVMLEWLQSRGMFGITAGALANSQSADSLIANAARYGGIYLVSFLIVLVNTLILGAIYVHASSRLAQRRFLSYTSVVLILLSGFCLYLKSAMPKYPSQQTVFQATLIQPNIAQYKKLSYRYVGLIAQELLYKIPHSVGQPSDLYIYPESLLPGVYAKNQLYYRLLAGSIPSTSALVCGTDRWESGRYFNSVYLLSATGNKLAGYDKEKLVPFGEYLPWRSLLDPLLPPSLRYMAADMSRGTENALFRLKNKYPFGISICFESIFPDIFYRQFKKGARFFVVLTNDGWFFNTPALKLHRNATAFRAIESGSQVFFCANTGESAVILPNGKSAKIMGYDQVGSIDDNIIFNKGVTFYYRFFYGLIYVSAFVLGILLIFRLRLGKKV